MTDTDLENRLWQAAVRLAASKPWRQVGLPDIALEAGMSLAEASACASSKAEVLGHMRRSIDRQFLESLEQEPLEGETHDRLFDAMLRRIELLTPYKPAIRSILADSARSPMDWITSVVAAVESQNWILAAAQVEATGLRGDLHKLGLARINHDILLIWLEDDDAGLARTMAALDRKLRDATQFAQRIETPLTVLSGLFKAARAFRQTRRTDPQAPNATTD